MKTNFRNGNFIRNEDEFYENKLLSEHDFEELRRYRRLDKKFDEMLKDIGIFLIFLFILYVVSFTNISNSAFNYNQLFINTFVQSQNSNEIYLFNVIIYKKININKLK